MSNFWRSLDLPSINCEVELDLSQSKNCIKSETSRTAAVGGDNPAEATLTTRATFQINNTKLNIPVVSLSINDKIF